jgi:D-alanyl-D-alanine carboxypeptidase
MTPEDEVPSSGCPADQPGWSPRTHLGLVVAAGLILALVGGSPGLASGQVHQNGAVPRLPVSAEAVVLLDLETGKVLFEKNAEGDRAPASLVKMMTLYIAFDELRAGHVTRGEPVTIGPNVMRTPRYRIGLVTGQVVPFDTLLAAVAIASANDAATAVAERLAESDEKFVERMNAEAERMGLSHTVFANPHGLPDPRQRTTARDMATLAENLIRDFPESRGLLGDTDFAWRGRLFHRRIPLFRDPGGVTALKTGFTQEARYNIAVAAAGRAGQKLLCVVLGAETRGLSFLDAGRLLRFGFGEPVSPSGRTGRRWRANTRGVPTK